MASRKTDYSPEAWERHLQRERDRYSCKKQDPEWRKEQTLRSYEYATKNRVVLDLIRRERGCKMDDWEDGYYCSDYLLTETDKNATDCFGYLTYDDGQAQWAAFAKAEQAKLKQWLEWAAQ